MQGSPASLERKVKENAVRTGGSGTQKEEVKD